jgi:hypothetical protein
MSTIPADRLPLLTSALREDLQAAAQAIGQCGPDSDIAAGLEHFDAIRATLDAIGWGNTEPVHDVIVDLDQHRDVLQAVLDRLLQAKRERRADAQRAGSEEERQHAEDDVIQLEVFMLEVLEMSEGGEQR